MNSLVKLEKMKILLGEIVLERGHSAEEDLFLRNAINSLDVYIKSRRRNKKNVKHSQS